MILELAQHLYLYETHAEAMGEDREWNELSGAEQNFYLHAVSRIVAIYDSVKSIK